MGGATARVLASSALAGLLYIFSTIQIDADNGRSRPSAAVFRAIFVEASTSAVALPSGSCLAER